jgi:hypothetical protein
MLKSTFLLVTLVLTVLFASQTLLAQGQINGVNMDRSSQWPKDPDGFTRIGVCWENPGNYSVQRGWVREAIASTWQKIANIEFSNWEQCSAYSKGIRIKIFDGHPHTKGLGKKLDGKIDGMELNFTFNNFPCGRGEEVCIKGIAAHEFGHALGLAHEQNRRDCSCNEPGQGSDGGYYVTECDLNSIMNYCNPRYNNNGELSTLDKKGIEILYGKRLTSISNLIATTFIDELGEGQTFENLYLVLGEQVFAFHVDVQNPTSKMVINFTQPGLYNYQVFSRTWYGNQLLTYSGQGQIQISNRGSYSFRLNADNKINIIRDN